MYGLLTETVPPIINEAVTWASAVKDLGSVGILALGAYLFLTGKLISGKVAREQTLTAVNAAKVTATNALLADIRRAVKEGFIEGWYEIHKSHEEAVIAAVDRKANAEAPTTPRTPRKRN